MGMTARLTIQPGRWWLLVAVLAVVAAPTTIAWAGPTDAQGTLVFVDAPGLSSAPAQDPLSSTLLAPHPVQDFDVAGDQRTVAAVGGRGVELVDVDTQARWSISGEPADTVAWDDQMARLALSSGAGLTILDLASAQRVPVATDPLTVFGNCGGVPPDRVTVDGWSHDGSLLVVTAIQDGCDEYGNSEAYSVDVATGTAHRLSTGIETAHVSVNPVHDLVVMEDDDRVAITGMRGEDRRQLDSGLGPVWSQDGERVAWGRHVLASVFVSDLDGPGVAIGDPFPSQPSVHAWSPDGGSLVVSALDEQNRPATWILDLATGERREVTSGSVLGVPLEWLGPVAGAAVVRSGGTDRVDTAARVALRWFPAPQAHAVVARADDFADALAAGSVTAADPGPVLLTASDQLSPATTATLGALGVERVTIVGGTAAVSASVEDQLRSLALEVTRLAGGDRYATAAVAADMLAGGEVALLASGTAFADALALAPLATVAGAPILLTAPDNLPAASAQQLQEHTLSRLLIAGGTAAVSADVERQAAAACACTPERLAGGDRTGTAVAIALELERLLGRPADGAFLAAGDRFPDALAGGPAAGRAARPILLTADRSTLGPALADYLAARTTTIARLDLIGDDSVLAHPDL